MEDTALREKRRPGLCELPWEPDLSPCSLAWARLFRDSRTSIISRWRRCFGSAESYFGDSISSASSVNEQWPLQFRSAAEFPFPKCSENDRRYDENVKKRTDHTAENRRGQWLHDFGTGMSRPHDWEQTCDNGSHRHYFRAQSKKGSFHHGLMQLIDC